MKSSPTHYAARAVHLHAAMHWPELTLELWLDLSWDAHTQGNIAEWPFAAFALLEGGFHCEAEVYNPRNIGHSSGIEDFAFL